MYEVGQKAWFFMSGHKGEKTEGEIVHIFERYGELHYVLAVEVPCLGEETLHVREFWCMSPAEDKPIELWRLKTRYNAVTK